MKYTKLGNSDLNVSRICMGCMGFGDAGRGQHSWTIDEEHSREIIKHGLDLGVNFYDTAIAYQSGTSEQYVGRALRDFAKRDDVVVATKFLPRTPEEIEAGITGQQHIENMINTSLKNLGMDYVDLYIYHMWDWNTPIEDIMDGLNRIVRAGKTRYIGISNCFAWQIAKANAIAEKEGFAKFVSVQGHYNLIFREEEREMVPYCSEENIALTPYSALAGGRLSRRPGEGGTKPYQYCAYYKLSTASSYTTIQALSSSASAIFASEYSSPAITLTPSFTEKTHLSVRLHFRLSAEAVIPLVRSMAGTRRNSPT